MHGMFPESSIRRIVYRRDANGSLDLRQEASIPAPMSGQPKFLSDQLVAG
jgi:hypothetical protein